jgi:pimeloyl-ACP methyl ester carboxylesterase
LGHEHRLVAIDLPGHGLSSWADDPASPRSPSPFSPTYAGRTGTAGRGRQFPDGGYKDEVAAIAQLSTSLAVIYGEQEQLINRNYTGGLAMPSLWRRELQLVPDAGHAPHCERPSVFNRLLEDFAKETAK